MLPFKSRMHPTPLYFATVGSICRITDPSLVESEEPRTEAQDTPLFQHFSAVIVQYHHSDLH
jgi:hypothetical protein